MWGGGERGKASSWRASAVPNGRTPPLSRERGGGGSTRRSRVASSRVGRRAGSRKYDYLHVAYRKGRLHKRQTSMGHRRKGGRPLRRAERRTTPTRIDAAQPEMGHRLHDPAMDVATTNAERSRLEIADSYGRITGLGAGARNWDRQLKAATQTKSSPPAAMRLSRSAPHPCAPPSSLSPRLCLVSRRSTAYPRLPPPTPPPPYTLSSPLSTPVLY